MLVGGWKKNGKSNWKRKRAWVKEVVASLAQGGNRLAADSHRGARKGSTMLQARDGKSSFGTRAGPGRQLLEARCLGEGVVMGKADGQRLD